MTAFNTFFLFVLGGVIWSCVFGLQRPPPRYSQQYMPQTSFTCRNKIVGSYYADPETDCQLFHVCVSVSGSIQDYRFLCPNDTAFDQESQTCADWYDVDCEAATLYYASDNFDLYRIGSGLESLHYDNIRSDFEPQDHLQRSESNDPIRSPLNSYNSNNYKESDTSKNSNVRANDYNSQYTSRNQKQIKSVIEKDTSVTQEPEKKTNLRKINRKPVNNGFVNAYTSKSTTVTPVPTQSRYNDKSFGQNFAYSSTTQRPSSQPVASTQKYNQPTSTLRPTTKYVATTARSIANSQDTYTNYQTTTVKPNFHNNFNNFNRFEANAKLTNVISTHYPEPQSYSSQFTQAVPSTTKQPVTDYQQHTQANNYYNNNNNYNSNYKNNYNNIQRTNVSSYSSSTVAYDSYSNNNNNNNNYYNQDNHQSKKADYNSNTNTNTNTRRTSVSSYPSSTTTYDSYNDNNNNNNNYYSQDNHQSKKADYNSNTYVANTYAPTTYSPVTKKFVNNNRQYYDKSTTLTTKTAQYTETGSTKAQKKVTQYKEYQNYEISTRSYDFGRSSVGLGFSPSSVNHLAENIRSTTPTPRRAAAPTTYNPNSFNINTHAPQAQQKSTYNQNQSAKPYSTTAKYYEETTARSKITKKNDYDYAYYDNGPLEYDNIELEHVSSNKESVKIT